MKSVTLRVNEDRLNVLDTIAEQSSVTRSKLIQDLIDERIELYSWQLVQIQRGIEDADHERWSEDTELLKLLLD